MHSQRSKEHYNKTAPYTMELLSLTDYVVVAKINSNCLFFWYLKLINV